MSLETEKIRLCFLNLALIDIALVNFPTPSPHQLAHPAPLPPLSQITPTSSCCYYRVPWGMTHLPFQADVHAASQSISKAKVMSRAGSLCRFGRPYPQRELLPGAKVTRVARNTDAFSWWQHCTVTANYRANPKYFYFEPLHPWGMKRGLENLLHIGYQDLWVWTKDNSHSDPYAKKKKTDILSFGET